MNGWTHPTKSAVWSYRYSRNFENSLTQGGGAKVLHFDAIFDNCRHCDAAQSFFSTAALFFSVIKKKLSSVDYWITPFQNLLRIGPDAQLWKRGGK